jgi:hypothetical protein
MLMPIPWMKRPRVFSGTSEGLDAGHDVNPANRAAPARQELPNLKVAETGGGRISNTLARYPQMDGTDL